MPLGVGRETKTYPGWRGATLVLFALLCVCSPAAAQTVQITSHTPEIQLQPGDHVQFRASVTYSGAPSRATLRLLLRETTETGTREIDGNPNSILTAGTVVLPKTYDVPHRACNGGSFWTCTEGGGVANFAQSLKKVSSLLLLVKMFDADGREIASATRPVNLTYPEIVSLSVTSQPLQSQSAQLIRLVARDTKFTNVDPLYGVGVSFPFTDDNDFDFRVGDQLGNFVRCDPLPEAVQAGGCAVRIVNDTTLEFKLRTVTGDATEAEVLRRVGPRDVRIFWQEKGKPAPEIDLRAPDAVQLGGFTFTAPLKNDATVLNKLDIIVDPDNPDPSKRKSYTLLPGATNTLVLDPGVRMRMTWGAGYRLSRLGYAGFWLLIRQKGKKSHLFAWGGDYLPVWNTFGETLALGVYQGHGVFGAAPNSSLELPAVDSDLEFLTCMTRPYLDKPGEECFAESPPIVVSRPNLKVERIEVVQAVQDEAGSVPLVARKRTAARLFVAIGDSTSPPAPAAGGLKPPSVAGVTAVLRASRDGRELLGSPLRPDNAPIDAPAKPDRADESQSLNFLLPFAWTTEGALTLEAEVNPDKSVNETDFTDNKKSVSVTFTKRNPLKVAYVAICYLTEATCPSAAIDTYDKKMARLFPVADADLEYTRLSVPRMIWRKVIPPGHKWNEDLIAALRTRFDLIEGVDKFSADQFNGWLPDLSLIAGAPKAALGTSDPVWLKRTGRVAFSQDSASNDAAGTPAFDSDAAFTLAHEIGHNLGLRHPNTADACGAADSDTDWRFPNAQIQEIGFDPDTMKTLPKTKFDVMSYCSPPGSKIWISPFSFKKLFDGNFTPRKRLDWELSRFATRAEPQARSAGSPTELLPRAGATEYLFITGSAKRDGSSGSLNKGYRLTSLTTGEPSLASGNHCLRFSGSSGTLSTYCFQLEFVEHRSHEPIEEESFALKVPYPPGTAAVALLRDGRELTSIRPSGQTPTIEIVSPRSGDTWSDTRTLSWSAFDADGGALTYAVLYSPDGGTSWLPLDLDLSDSSLAVDTSEIAAGSQIYFRVLASDGLNTGAATVGPIAVVRSSNVLLRPPALDFGNVRVGESKDLRLAVANLGSQPLTLTRITSSNARFAVVAPSTPVTLAADGRQTVAVRFSATASGAQTGTLSLATSDPAQPTLSVPLTANGVTAPQPRLALAAATVDFGPVTVASFKDLPVTVWNRGNAPLRIRAISIDDAAFRTDTAPPLEVAPDGSALVLVRYSPVTEGSRTGRLLLQSDDPDRPAVTVTLTGTGVGNPAITALEPQTGAPGSILVITGRNFSATLPDNLVRFGGLAARAVSATPARIEVVVPAELEEGSLLVTVVVSGRPSNSVPLTILKPATTPDPTRKYFAHFGTGGSLVSSVVLTNPSRTRTATGTVRFAADAGQALAVSLNGAAPSDASSFSIPPLGSATLTTDGSGVPVTGSARVESSIPVGGVVKFSVPGLGIAGVGESTPYASLMMPALRDQARGLNTGIAVNNSESVEQNLLFSLRGLDGRQVSGGSSALPVAANGHIARFIHELFPSAQTSNFEGTLVVSTQAASRKFTATVLQVGQAAGEFTTLPVVGIDPPGAVTSLTFAQFGNGPGLTSSFFLLNPLTSAVTGEVGFFNDSGARAPISINGRPAADRAIFSIEALGGAVLKTDGTGDPVSGSARVTASGGVGGVLKFALPGAGIAGVGTSSLMPGFITPVRRSVGEGRSTGLAMASDVSVTLSITLRNAAGAEVPGGQASLTLPANGHVARFIQELFPGADTREFAGTVTVSVSGGRIAATALELGSGPGEFTTLPVTPLEDEPSSGNPVPAITAIDPSSKAAGSPGFTLSVAGRNFVSGARVRWNGSDRTTTFVSATALQAAIPASDVAAAGSAAVTVSNPAPGGGLSGAATFTVTAVAAPAIDVAPAALDFGAVTVGQVNDLTLTVRNTGSADLRVSGTGSSNPLFSATSPAIPFTIAPAAQQTVTVRFAPTAAGAQSGTLTIVNNDPGRAALAVPLSGTGAVAGAPSIQLAPASLDFGPVVVGRTGEETLTVSNTGNAPLTVSAIISSSSRFTVVSPAPPFNVASGAGQAVRLRFAPAASGAQTATLTIASNDARGNATVNLAGTGVSGAPEIGAVTVTKLDADSARIDLVLSDPAGDVVKIEYAFFRSGALQTTRVVNSPADINLAGQTSGIVSRTFTGLSATTPFGTVFPDRVDIEATDTLGAKSNKVSKTF